MKKITCVTSVLVMQKGCETDLLRWLCKWTCHHHYHHYQHHFNAMKIIYHYYYKPEQLCCLCSRNISAFMNLYNKLPIAIVILVNLKKPQERINVPEELLMLLALGLGLGSQSLATFLRLLEPILDCFPLLLGLGLVLAALRTTQRKQVIDKNLS